MKKNNKIYASLKKAKDALVKIYTERKEEKKEPVKGLSQKLFKTSEFKIQQHKELITEKKELSQTKTDLSYLNGRHLRNIHAISTVHNRYSCK